MKKYILKNGIRLIYEHSGSMITSFCLGFNAGALEEEDFNTYGTAHALEHMLFKGTKTRSEFQINKRCDELFGFNNAMTNYPYAIYYGTLLSVDFRSGFELFSDIILNPLLDSKGFAEEINVILEELKEWKDDAYQYCEDELLFNSFNSRRIKFPIIGTQDSIKNINIDTIRKFYEKYYVPGNCVITIASSLEFDEILTIVEHYFGSWSASFTGLNPLNYEENISGKFIDEKDINGAKIIYAFPIDNLSREEIKALSLINFILGTGTSSVLYDRIRTKNGLAYEIWSDLKTERGIKLLKIMLGTSSKNIDRALKIIDDVIYRSEEILSSLKAEDIINSSKAIRLRRMLKVERSIELCKNYTTYELMGDSAENVLNEVADIECLNSRCIIDTARKVLVKPSIEIIMPYNKKML
jgi:predicted Zn-dependent peptidase